MIAAAATSSCHTPKQIANNTPRPMPGAYISGTDSTQTTLPAWNQLFNDKGITTLIDTALANNWDLRTAWQRMQSAQAMVLANKGNLAPFMRVGGSGGFNKFSDYTMDGAGNIGTRIYDGRFIPTIIPDYLAVLQSSWEADVWGKLRSKKKAAISRFLASAEGKNIIVTNLVAQVATSYYDLQSMDGQLDYISQTIKLQENALEVVRVQKDAGAATQLAVEQFEAQLAGTKCMRLDVLRQIQETENKLNLLLGRYPQHIFRTKMVLDPELGLHVKAGIPAALLQNRPDIRQAEAELLAAGADVKAAMAEFYPTITINARLGVDAFKARLLFTTPQALIYGVVGGLSAPLLNRTAIKANLQQAEAAKQEALNNYQQAVVRGYSEVYTELQRINNLEEVYQLRTAQATTLDRSIETASELFKTGRSTYLEVLVTQQNALQSAIERINTRKNQLQAIVNIYRALGGGWQ